MLFRDAVTAHTGWKLRVARYLSCPDGTLQAAAARQDNRCELGRWLYGEGRSFQLLAEYQRLLAVHTRLHESAGELVHRANLGEPVSKERSMNEGSPFGIATKELVGALERLKARTGL